jgi:antitoxin component of RelBE/YafQ-DinJ toxin-antitoxin module
MNGIVVKPKSNAEFLLLLEVFKKMKLSIETFSNTLNETTLKAIKEVDSKKLKRFKDVKDLMNDLNS